MNARIERLNELLKQSPKDGFIRFALAKEMEKIGRLEDAVEGLRELLNDQPEYIGAYYHLAGMLERLGRGEDALQVYDSGLEMASSMNDTHAWSELQQAKANLASG